MKTIKHLTVFILLCLLINSCVKDEWIFNDNISVDNLDPSFALPIAQTTLNLGDLEQHLDSESFVYSEEDETFWLVYPNDLFELRADDLIELPSQEFEDSYSLSSSAADAFNLAGAGTIFNYNNNPGFNITVENGAEIDSILFKGGSLLINLESDFEHDVEIVLSIPGLRIGSIPFSTTLNLDWMGSVPVLASFEQDLTGYSLDLTDSGLSNNFMALESSIEITHSGENVSTGDEIDYELSMDMNEFKIIHGYVGQQTEILAVDTQNIDIFADLNGGILHFENPSIDLRLVNSSGVPVELDLTSVYSPDDNVSTVLSGDDLENIPIIEPALFPGDEVTTSFSITNEGTNPTLSDMMDDGPFNLIYSIDANTNPLGFMNNFIEDTSSVKCFADVILPFYGYADNFALADTSDADIESIMGLDDTEESNLDAEDIEKVTIRLVVDNGLPVDVGVQVYFMDTLDVLVDSLFENTPYNFIFNAGFVDFSLPDSNPNHGRVISDTRTVSDIILTQEKIQFLVDNNAKKVVLKTIANTNSASSGEVIKIYPEYEVSVKVSAKIDTDIDLNE